MTTSTTNPGNNGNLNELLLGRKFVFTIKITDSKTYHQVINYLTGMALKSGVYGENLWDKRYYVFDREKKQIAKTERQREVIELTAESSQIKGGIEEIIYQN
jgi:hypothetical protein